jgi:hypothetical protein
MVKLDLSLGQRQQLTALVSPAFDPVNCHGMLGGMKAPVFYPFFAVSR